MRKQYHFRNSECGLLAWDVDRLIRLTHGLQAVEVPLEEIRELDEAYWYGPAAEPPTCRSIAGHVHLIQAADLAWPIILCPAGRVMDGMHRVVRALVEGRPSVLAYRLPALPEPDHLGVDPDDLDYEET